MTRPWPLLLTLALLAGAAGVRAQTSAEPELLPAAEAFRFEVKPRGDVARVQVTIAPGYYLYRDRIGIEPATEGLEIGAPRKPEGIEKQDPFFGTVHIYRERATIDVPLTALPAGAASVDLAVTSQGCADLGVCYPPDTRTLTVAIGAGAGAAPAGGRLDALARIDAAFGVAAAGSGGTGDEFLPVDEAFRVDAVAGAPGEAVVRFDIADGYYLYRARMGFEIVGDGGATPVEPRVPAGKLKHDAYFGEMEVYYHGVEARVPLAGASASPVRLKVRYQGCAEAGLCYPPQERELTVAAAAGAAAGSGPSSSAAVADGALSETDQLARSLTRDALGWVLATFFVAGLLLAFTPCVLPMVPILSAIIAGQDGEPSGRRGLALSAVYVLAMSLTYTVAGVLAGLFGQNLQALFQHPGILIGFSLVFVALSLSMFGFYELQLPAAFQARLAALSHRQRGGSYLGVGVMGVLSALIVGPCVAAPLAAALIVIGSTGDPVRGGLALFALSLGMGVPLLAVGAFGARLLPKAGPWMVLVKHVFGVLLLAVAIYLLGRLVPDAVTMAMWAALLLGSAAALAMSTRAAGLRAFAALGRAQHVRLGVAAVAMLYGVVLAVGAAPRGGDPLRPLDGIGRERHASLEFQRIKSVADLDRLVAQAHADGRAVMLDFYADWCVSCKELERETFSEPKVRSALADVLLLQADVTAYDDVDRELLGRFGLIGPPAILFFGADGRERREFRVIGFMDAATFEPHVARARAS